KALDVLNALLRRLERSGATLALSEPLREVNRVEGGFAVITSTRTLFAPKVIVTTGGKSYPGSGTTGDGYDIAAKFGHTIVPPRPALTPILVEAPWIAALRGVTLPDASLRIIDGDKPLIAKRDSLLFAHFGLSGPAALDASRAISLHQRPESLQLE